jgi:shikimate dehydrogenase
MRRRCAVLGSPIGHSLSPVLHRAAYAALGLDWEYDALEVSEDGLAAFLDSLDDAWRGLSLTMPLKRAVMPLLDEASDRAVQAGAANTVVLDGGRRVGHKTATSLLLALADLGCTSGTLLVREPARAAETLEAVARHPRAPQVDVRRLDDPGEPGDVLVSTIPASAQTPALVALGQAARVVFEVVYDPWPTPLAAAALRQGTPLVSGLDLLLHQAALQVELMTGLPAPMAAMRTALPTRTG